MQGLITTRHLFFKAPTIIHEFGLQTYLKCVAAAVKGEPNTTFLECAVHCEAQKAEARQTPSKNP